jgi:hypothetical protein
MEAKTSTPEKTQIWVQEHSKLKPKNSSLNLERATISLNP